MILANIQKDHFYESLLWTTLTMKDKDVLIMAGNARGQVGKHSNGPPMVCMEVLDLVLEMRGEKRKITY